MYIGVSGCQALKAFFSKLCNGVGRARRRSFVQRTRGQLQGGGCQVVVLDWAVDVRWSLCMRVGPIVGRPQPDCCCC